MDTPNISGAKTTTTSANLAGGWYTTLVERTKRSNYSWSMIPFTEPNYSVPDGSSRKVGEANVPTIFSLDLTEGGRVPNRPPHLLNHLQSYFGEINNPASGQHERRVNQLAHLGEELVRYLATGMSIAHLNPVNRRARLEQAAVAATPLDFVEWMRLNGPPIAEVRMNEWGSGGPINWLAQRAGFNEAANGGNAPYYTVGDFPNNPGILGRRLKAPVMCLYVHDRDYIADLAEQFVAIGNDGIASNADLGIGSRMVNNNDGIVSGTGFQIVFALNLEDASRMVSSDPFGNTIAVYAHNRDTHVLCHPMIHHQYAYRLRHVLENIGAERPSLNYIGLGHVNGDNQIQRPTLGWSVGQLAYNGANYRADGSCYIPSDYFPYSMLKRTAKLNHVITQVGTTWMRGLSAYGPGDANQSLPVGVFASSLPSMVQLLWGEQFGYTTTPSIPTEPYFDPESIASRVDEFLIQGHGSGVLAFDTGAFLNAPLQFLNALQTIREADREFQIEEEIGYTIPWVLDQDSWSVIGLTNLDGAQFNIEAIEALPDWNNGMAAAAIESLEIFGYQQALENVWATVKAAIGPMFQVPLTPMTMLHSGGPRPGHVVERLQMNFRPDINVSGGSAGSKPYFLMPSQLNPGETLIRMPTLLDTRQAAASARPNVWLGPRDPTVLTGVETIHYDGDRPREVTNPDYALESPIIVRDATAGQFEVNDRPISMRVYPRPAYHRVGYNLAGVFNSLTHGIESASGNYYLYPDSREWHLADSPGAGCLVMTGANNFEVIRQGAGDGNVNMANRAEEFIGINGNIRMTARSNPQLDGLLPENNAQALGSANPEGRNLARDISLGGGGIDNPVGADDDAGDVE